MRGVLLRGRRLPANRSAGPARPPVVPAAVPQRSRRAMRSAASPPPTGPRPEGHPHGTGARRSITTRQGAAHESAARGTRFARGSPAPWRPVCDRDNHSCPGIGQQPMTCTDSRWRHRSFRRERRPPQPLAGQPTLLLPAIRHLAAAGPAATRACRAHELPLGSWTGRPRRPAWRVRAVLPRHRVKPCPPPISHRFRGAVATA
jgi:hypothetical protein